MRLVSAPDEILTFIFSPLEVKPPNGITLQYPQWRPPAQWSKTLGFSHTEDFNLFSLGEVSVYCDGDDDGGWCLGDDYGDDDGGGGDDDGEGDNSDFDSW